MIDLSVIQPMMHKESTIIIIIMIIICQIYIAPFTKGRFTKDKTNKLMNKTNKTKSMDHNNI